MKKFQLKKWPLLAGAFLSASLAVCLAAEEEKPSEKQTALEAASASEQELIRRQEATIFARQNLKEAQQNILNGDYEKALGKYEEAVKRLILAPASAEEAEQARRGKSLCLYQLAQDAYKRKDFSRAMTHAENAYNVDPSNRDAASLYEKASGEDAKIQNKKNVETKAHEALGPEITNEDFVKKQRRVLDLYRSAENYLKSEQFDQAEKCLKSILLIDPYSATAYHRLREVQLSKQRKLLAGRQQTESESMLDVQKGWLMPVRRDKPVDTQLGGVDDQVFAGANKKIVEKLNTLIIKRIEFVSSPLKDAVNRLIEWSREADPTKEGVNIIMDKSVYGGGGSGGTTESAAPVAAAPPAMPGGGELAPPSAFPQATTPSTSMSETTGGGGATTVTLNLVNVPLGQAIKYLTTTTGLKYIIDKNAVVLVSGEAVTRTETRFFNVSPGVFRSEVERGAEAGGGGGGGFVTMGTGGKVTKLDIKKIFEGYGITFPPGTSVAYQESAGLLIATHSNDVLDQIDGIMMRLNKVIPQVQIEAKFIEIRQTDLEELGFRWAFAPSTQNEYTVESGTGTALPGIPIGGPYRGLGNPLTSGLRNAGSVAASALDALLTGGATLGTANAIMTITGVMTNPQFQVFIDALSQKGFTNLLSAPRVTTTSGESAKIMVTREFIYPSSFTDPQVQTGTSSTTGGTGSVGITAPSPSGFSTREVGVILDVKPTVGQDNYTISLTLSPEVVDFDGMVFYNTYAVANTTSYTFTIPQPIFSKRSLSTSVTIWDGNVVVLGGLIREDNVKVNDKVPILGDIPLIGRFFQSKVDSTTKRNLMIFLTARIVDPSGRPIRDYQTIEAGLLPTETSSP